jgi:hypothetical protein
MKASTLRAKLATRKQRPDLLVCSVFTDEERSRFWLEMQYDWLARTAGAFDHAVFLNRADETLFRHSRIIGRADIPRNGTHIIGLRAIAAYCQTTAYKYYLVLDSDCFPILPDWPDILLKSMRRSGKSFAAPARTENLDIFPHPSAVFTTDARCLTFGIRKSPSLLGTKVRDVICTAPRAFWFPLLKSNRVTVHPVLSTVYYGIFYHHGCGSREFGTRAITAGYYDHLLDTFPSDRELMEQLRMDPARYIAQLC